MPDIQDLPEEIEPGEIEFTFSYDPDGRGPTLFDFRATWNEGSTMTWWQDISEKQGGLSPGSSAPSKGWASWRNGVDLLIAYTWPDVGVDGWTYVPDGAPISGGDDDAMYERETWLHLARTVLGAVHGQLPNAIGQTFE
ncbi:hypothetical protein [Mycolicibacterium elephantis]|uniref:hypothetical protein n=1 Tax=Mycolicibacterium elephantis TaxID=81858 RepID=UPI000FE19FCA|nr:hypothetical protein [Mycolicibacterium elephantis]MCV7220819.1 hypothetical protein [Mycolicibacterium elephantis]